MEETENMNKLVQSLLFLSRAERGFITFNSERFNIKEIVENEVKRAENLNTEDKKVIVDIKDKFFVGDKEQLTAVIKNLVENSFKYVEPEGEIIIKSENNRFTIGNTSHISEKEIENIWLPFYRADKARDRKLGTGLGLAIVKEILESHKLKYGVYKEDDKIIFPVSKEEKNEKANICSLYFYSMYNICKT